VVGDRRPYIAALITLNEEVPHEGAEEQMQAVLDDVNRDLSRYEQIKRFTILPRDFSADEGEVTPTLKLKRRVCQEHFAAEIEGLYS
jgi:long-chain acyl-CoA synthetase